MTTDDVLALLDKLTVAENRVGSVIPPKGLIATVAAEIRRLRRGELTVSEYTNNLPDGYQEQLHGTKITLPSSYPHSATDKTNI